MAWIVCWDSNTLSMFLDFWLSHLYLHLYLFFHEVFPLYLIKYFQACSLNMRKFLDVSHHDEDKILYLKTRLKKIIIEGKKSVLWFVLFTARQAQKVLSILLFYPTFIGVIYIYLLIFFFCELKEIATIVFLFRKIMGKTSAWFQSCEFSHGGMNINNAEKVLSKNRSLVCRKWKPLACITVAACSRAASSAQTISTWNLLSLGFMLCLTFHWLSQNKLQFAEQSLDEGTCCCSWRNFIPVCRSELCSLEVSMGAAIWAMPQKCSGTPGVCSVCSGQSWAAATSWFQPSAASLEGLQIIRDQPQDLLLHHWEGMDQEWPSCLGSPFQWCTRWFFIFCLPSEKFHF